MTFVIVTSSPRSTIHQTGLLLCVCEQLPVPKLLFLLPSTALVAAAVKCSYNKKISICDQYLFYGLKENKIKHSTFFETPEVGIIAIFV